MNIYNTSHCFDPTPKKALDNIKEEEKAEKQKQRAKDLIGCLFRICSLANYEIVTDITIRDRFSGVVYSSKKKGE